LLSFLNGTCTDNAMQFVLAVSSYFCDISLKEMCLNSPFKG
jgi:hypothetical protein